MRLFILVLLIFPAFHITAQHRSIKSQLEVEMAPSDNTFYEKVEKMDAIFAKTYPNKTSKQLTSGVHRDGKYVKFQRWKNYWRYRLDKNSRINFKPSKPSFKKNIDLDTVSWTNLHHTQHITGQIGMGRTTSMAFHPTNPLEFYVSAAIGGIWKTTDGGISYTPIGDNLPFLAVSSILLDQSNPSVMYAATGDHVFYGPPSIGVYKTTDGGASWNPTALQFNFTDNTQILWMEADPNNSQNIFIATSKGLYKSSNGMQTVSMLNNLNVTDIKFMPFQSQIIYLGTSDGSLYKSVDGGQSFSPIISTNLGPVKIAVAPTNANKIYFRANTTLYKSQNQGNSFISCGLPENNTVLAFAPLNDNILIAGNFETHRSNNDGDTFNAITNWLGFGLPLIHVDQRNIFSHPMHENFLYLTNDGGVFRYDVTADTFEDLSAGLLITQYYDIAVAQSNATVLGGGSQDNGNIFRGTNGLWDDYAPTGDGMNQDIDPRNENVRYWEYQHGDILRWTNGSNTNIAPTGKAGSGAWETPFKLDPSNPDRLVIGYDMVYESLNQGSSWSTISAALAGGNNLDEIAIAPTNPDKIYAVWFNNIYTRIGNTSSWTTHSIPGVSTAISDIEVDLFDENIVYATVSGYVDGQKVYRSSDSGNSWTNISGSLENVPVLALELGEIDCDEKIFIGTDNGVYFYDESTGDWTEYGNMIHTSVTDIEFQKNSNLIRIGTHGRGMFEASLEALTFDVTGDMDMDRIPDVCDDCPELDNALIGTPCDDGDPSTTGETYTIDCLCAAELEDICSAQGTVGTGGDWISNVMLEQIDHSSTQTFYSDFTYISTDLEIGQSYTLQVELNFSFNLDVIYAWIDFNGDNVFAPDEEIIMSQINSNHISTGTVNVPESIAERDVVMRVRSRYGDNPPHDPCGDYFGEVEDYTVELIECNIQPNVLSELTISSGEQIIITASGGSEYMWSDGSTSSSLLVSPTTTTTYLVTVTDGICDEVASITVNVLTVVPITLKNFKGVLKDRYNLLKWEVAESINFSHFQIQKSSEEFSDFEKIGEIPYHGESNYSFNDYNPDNDSYYRLKLENNDGTYDYSEIVSLSRTDTKEIELFPNPFHQSFEIRNAELGSDQIKVYTITGQEIPLRIQIKSVDNLMIEPLSDYNGILIIKVNDRFLKLIKL